MKRSFVGALCKMKNSFDDACRIYRQTHWKSMVRTRFLLIRLWDTIEISEESENPLFAVRSFLHSLPFVALEEYSLEISCTVYALQSGICYAKD